MNFSNLAVVTSEKCRWQVALKQKYCEDQPLSVNDACMRLSRLGNGCENVVDYEPFAISGKVLHFEFDYLVFDIPGRYRGVLMICENGNWVCCAEFEFQIGDYCTTDTLGVDPKAYYAATNKDVYFEGENNCCRPPASWNQGCTHPTLCHCPPSHFSHPMKPSYGPGARNYAGMY